MDYILLIVGLGMLLLAANYLVDSSVAIAQRAKISNFIIGLTIVGIGTSAPELFGQRHRFKHSQYLADFGRDGDHLSVCH